IYQIKIGNGLKKILIWTQMHGNECTGTKSAIDLINFMNTSDNEIVDQILSSCTIKIIPILNPDGAEYFTRFNANKIDLNRDAVERKAKESILLRKILDDFNPEFCFNLHDQRTIFGVEGTRNPATISFLAPSEDETRKVTKTRKKMMKFICSFGEL
ncbi:M14 family zinc carboxypeptidase, partial [Flavobacteriaceae bacterium]|nr:M14 family zinc carboxypeptidase [Flavobacteriaceae bacterium]